MKNVSKLSTVVWLLIGTVVVFIFSGALKITVGTEMSLSLPIGEGAVLLTIFGSILWGVTHQKTRL